MTKPTTSVSNSTESQGDPAPERTLFVVDLGTQSRKRIKKLKRGRGKLLEKIEGVLAHVAADENLPEGATPIFLVNKERRGISDLFDDDD